MSREQLPGKIIAAGLLAGVLAGCTPDNNPTQPTPDNPNPTTPTAGLVEPTRAIEPTQEPVLDVEAIFNQNVEEVSPFIEEYLQIEGESNPEFTVLDVVRGEHLITDTAKITGANELHTSVDDQNAYWDQLAREQGADLLTGQPISSTEETKPQTSEQLAELLNVLAGNPDYIVATTVVTPVDQNIKNRVIIIVRDVKNNITYEVALMQDGDDPNTYYSTFKRPIDEDENEYRTVKDGNIGKGAVFSPSGSGNTETAEPTAVPYEPEAETPQEVIGLTDEEIKEIAEILGEKEVNVLRIPGQGSMGPIDLVTGGNASGERGKVLGFEIPEGWDTSIGDPQRLNQETFSNMLYPRWKLQHPDSPITLDEFTRQLLSGELTDTIITYPVNDGNGGIKQEQVDLEKGVTFGLTDYDTFLRNREDNKEDTLHFPVTNNVTGFSYFITEGKLYVIVSKRSSYFRQDPGDSMGEVYHILEDLATANIASAQPGFDEFAGSLQASEDIIRRWEDLMRGASSVTVSEKMLGPLYNNYSPDKGPTIALNLEMEIPHANQ